jgi:hypothetical protein
MVEGIKTTRPLRLMVYDRTCTGRGLLPGLTHSWRIGGWLYYALNRLDDWTGASSWAEALEWLSKIHLELPIAEIQFWGHGKWGGAFINKDVLNIAALHAGHHLNHYLLAIRDRLLSDEQALWWFRTCETFGADIGQRFAKAWVNFFNCRATGHTYIIGPFQSGLHTLKPGEEPNWSPWEGLKDGTPATPKRALGSRPSMPNTITCLHGRIPFVS